LTRNRDLLSVEGKTGLDDTGIEGQRLLRILGSSRRSSGVRGSGLYGTISITEISTDRATNRDVSSVSDSSIGDSSIGDGSIGDGSIGDGSSVGNSSVGLGDSDSFRLPHSFLYNDVRYALPGRVMLEKEKPYAQFGR